MRDSNPAPLSFRDSALPIRLPEITHVEKLGFPISRFINTGHKSDLTSTGGTHHRTKESVVIALSRIILENNKTEKTTRVQEEPHNPPPWEKKTHSQKRAKLCCMHVP